MSRFVEVWEFHCPECGIGHRELGRLAADIDIFCVVCEHETARQVTLRRWLPDHVTADHSAMETTARKAPAATS